MNGLGQEKYLRSNDNKLLDFQENIFDSVTIWPASYSFGQRASGMYNAF